MYRKPYHLCPPNDPKKCGPDADPNEKVWMNQNTMIGVSLGEFFASMEWKDWAESVPFMRSVKEGNKQNKAEVSISKPSPHNYTYPNVFALRRHKLQIMQQVIHAMPRNVKLVRLKEVESDPERFIQVSNGIQCLASFVPSRLSRITNISASIGSGERVQYEDQR